MQSSKYRPLHDREKSLQQQIKVRYERLSAYTGASPRSTGLGDPKHRSRPLQSFEQSIRLLRWSRQETSRGQCAIEIRFRMDLARSKFARRRPFLELGRGQREGPDIGRTPCGTTCLHEEVWCADLQPHEPLPCSLKFFYRISCSRIRKYALSTADCKSKRVQARQGWIAEITGKEKKEGSAEHKKGSSREDTPSYLQFIQDPWSLAIQLCVLTQAPCAN